MKKLGYILIILLLPIAYAAEETVYVGEEFLLKTKIVDDKGNLISDAKVTALSEFFSTQLYDDGLHEDDKANDGVYANRISVNAPKGIYNVKILVEKETYSDTQELILNVKEKPKYTFFVYLGVGLAVILVLLLGQQGLKEKATTRDLLVEKKKHIKEMMEQAKQAYYNRELDEEQYNRTIEKYEQELIDIDVKMKSLKKK